MILKSFLFSLSLFAVNFLFAQYTLNGNASQNDCHCYTLTNDAFNQTGSVWNNNKINLTRSFDFKFDVFLGCADSDGADGIAFVLQPISTSVGTTGNGLGYSGVRPAMGVTIDTWQNGSPTTDGADGDPTFDHIAIQLNGDLNHKDSVAPLPVNNIAGPVTALAGNDNIEDCRWHILRIVWDEPAKTFSAYMDGVLRVSAVKDFVTDVFGGDPMVFWGFTGSTGGAKNLQQMCTALKPLFKFLPDQKRCIGEKITFLDSSISFAPLQKRYWEFGDGSPVDSVNVNPVHAYTSAGKYTVIQTVLGADGCIEINTQQLIIGSVPLAKFTFNNACSGDSSINFINVSTAAFGTINQWFWDFGDGSTDSTQQSSRIYATPGFKTVKLAIKSLEGCVSDTFSQVVQVYEKPVSDFSFTNNQCAHTAVKFAGTAVVNDGPVSNWIWNLDSAGTVPAYVRYPSNTYDAPGKYVVWLVTKSSHGCVSDTVVKSLTIVPSPVANFNNMPICISEPALFVDSSYSTVNTITSWWWGLGNGDNPTTKNATTIYNSPGVITVQLAVKSSNGCTSDTLRKIIDIESKPLAKFGYALPVCENQSLQLADSSTIISGSIKTWYWSFDNGGAATTPTAVTVFASGNHQVKLLVKNGNGCNSDTAIGNLFINPRPNIDYNFSNACKNSMVSFTGINRSAGGIAEWHWAFDDGTISVSQDTEHVFANGGIFRVNLFAISSAGCYSDTLQKEITIYSTVAFAGNDTIAATNQPIQLSGSGGISYEWRPATGLSDPTISNPVATNNMDRSYVLRAFTPFGCESFDTIRIKIYDGPEIYVPNAFTPNGDGLNELLKALPVGVKKFKAFQVYNRLGQIVFSTSEYLKGWDGFFKGKAQPSGVYIWTASAIGFNGNEIAKKGTVVLIR